MSVVLLECIKELKDKVNLLTKELKDKVNLLTNELREFKPVRRKIITKGKRIITENE